MHVVGRALSVKQMSQDTLGATPRPRDHFSFGYEIEESRELPVTELKADASSAIPATLFRIGEDVYPIVLITRNSLH